MILEQPKLKLKIKIIKIKKRLPKMEKASIFKTELGYIKNEEFRNEIKDCIENVVPDYFFEVPASSTGKYHPSYALGEGGLVRHTQAAVRIAYGLFPLTNYTDDQKDFIIAALILHDTFKHGKTHEKYARADHPFIAAVTYDEYFSKIGLSETGALLSSLIMSHMGQWNKDWKLKKKYFLNLNLLGKGMYICVTI